jgi:hypothetical protein
MNPELITHYYSTPLYLTHFEKTGKSGGFIKLPFQHPKSLVDPNIITYPQLEKFKTTNMYIFRKSMNIPNYDAELVVEHISSTNFGTPIYVVFLLKRTENTQWTSIDDILAASSNTLLGEKPSSIHLDKLAANAIQNACLTNVNGSVYVLTQPIPISDLHILDDLTVSNTMLLEHSFNLENAVQCRIASFQDTQSKNILSGDKPVIEGATTMADIDLSKVEFDCKPGDIEGEDKILMEVGTTDRERNKNSLALMSTIPLLSGVIGIIFYALFKQVTDPDVRNNIHFVIRILLMGLIFSGFMMFIKTTSSGITVGLVLFLITFISYALLLLITNSIVPGAKFTGNFFDMLIKSGPSQIYESIKKNPGIKVVIFIFLVILGPIFVGVFAGLPKFKHTNKPGPKAGLAIGIIFMVSSGLIYLLALLGSFGPSANSTCTTAGTIAGTTAAASGNFSDLLKRIVLMF